MDCSVTVRCSVIVMFWPVQPVHRQQHTPPVILPPLVCLPVATTTTTTTTITTTRTTTFPLKQKGNDGERHNHHHNHHVRIRGCRRLWICHRLILLSTLLRRRRIRFSSSSNSRMLLYSMTFSGSRTAWLPADLALTHPHDTWLVRP